MRRDAQIGSRTGSRTAAIKFQRCSALSLVEAAHCQFGRRGDPIVGLEPTSSTFWLEGAGRSTASILSQATKTKKWFGAEHLVSPCIRCSRLSALCGERTDCLLDPFVTILQVHRGMGQGQGIAFRKNFLVELIPNVVVAVVKLGATLFTASDSMAAEAVHSIVDVVVVALFFFTLGSGFSMAEGVRR
jgi:hypothetical protein